MASVPILRKTWQFSANNVISTTTDSTMHRSIIKLIKDGLKGVALHPWTVVGSGGGGTFGLDGVDRWSTTANMGSGTWIVLKQTAIGSNFQVCLTNTLEFPADFRFSVVVSQSAGFTGGNATTRPTATDEVTITISSTDLTSTTSAIAVNIAVSDDGECSRFWAFQAGRCITVGLIDKLQNSANLTIPWIGLHNNRFDNGSNNNAASYNDFFGSTGAQGFQTTAITYNFVTASSFLGNAAGFNNGLNQLSSEFAIAPIWPICVTSTKIGFHGEVFDVWSGSISVNSGDTYPATGDSFVQVGNVVFPWNGTVPNRGTGSSTRRASTFLFGGQGTGAGQAGGFDRRGFNVGLEQV